MHRIKHGILIIIALLQLVSCSEVEESLPPTFVDQTIIMYMPWSGNLTDYFRDNISDMAKAIAERASESERVICFLATTESAATLFEMRYYSGKYVQTELKEYNVSTFTTSQTLSSFIMEVKQLAPSNRYSMIVASHGTAWLPVGTELSTYTQNADTTELITRYFGALTSEYQIEISTFAQGVEDSQTHLEYLLFDACYMSNIDVAYTLKDVTDYIIASPTEVLSSGFPYAQMSSCLFGDINYQEIVTNYYNYYVNYKTPYGSLAVISTQYIDALATTMKSINANYTFKGDRAAIQTMDTFSPTIFFDLGDYVDNLCEDTQLLLQFTTQLTQVVPYKAHTPTYYDIAGDVEIKSFSGLTTTDISISPKASAKSSTEWYKATH